MTANKQFNILQKTLAWAVHAFTASGLISGFMAILAINEKDWVAAMLWLILCLIIDGIDGTFARMANVKEVLPNVDGGTMDYIIDFATYAIIPAYFFYMAELVPEEWRLICVSVILLVSALYYAIEGMVSREKYFVGFPVLWNMVVFYLIFVFQASPMMNVLLVFVFAVLHFIPIKFVYPSRTQHFKKLTISVTIVFILTLVALLYVYPARPLWMVALAYGTVAYYAGMGIYDTWINPKS